MTFQRVVLLLALLTAGGILTAQQRDDPKEPPGPGDVGRTEKGARFQLPELQPIAVRRPEPLRVESFEVHELAAGTQSGEPGDLLVTFQGQGFQLTAKAPRLLLAGGEVVLEQTEVDLAGTRLYVVIPRKLIPDLERLEFREVVVRNPGALEDTEFSRALVKATARELLRPKAGAPKARLVYRKGEFVRELVEQ